MTQSVTAWLARLGLERYAESFVAADVDLEIIGDLTDADLEKLGVSLGDRKRILRAIDRTSESRTPPDATSSVPARASDTGERRQLSVVFCDLIGSTELASRLDPEDLRSMIKSYHERCSEIVALHGGEIAQFLGDGVMVQFGYPRAHEDDVERAARCALDLVDAVHNMDFPSGLRLRTRAGIATGTEVVGDIGGSTRDRMSVVGTTPSLASRLQSVAEPETVVITSATRRLLGNSFALTDLPSRPIKGIGDDVPLWRIERERRGANRFALRHAVADVRFVGRDTELALLHDRWLRAVSGEGCAVLLIGEAGVGKSRILEEFLRAPGDARPEATIRLQCAPNFASSALLPVRDYIERVAEIVPSDTVAQRLAKLAALDAGSSAPATSDAFSIILGLDDVDLSPDVCALSIEQRKALVFRTLLGDVTELAKVGPVRFVIEDLHWVDPSTLEFLTLLIETIGDDRVLVVATARPEFLSPWTRQAHVTSLSVDRLGRAAAEAMVAEIGRESVFGDDLVAQILERADGVPLFVEELTRSVIEAIATGVKTGTIPSSLRDTLTARLDALASDREVAQFGAIVGREFSIDLLCAVGDRSEAALRPALDRVLASGLVRRQGVSGTKFAFKHALVRDVAYESLLRPRRQELHLRAARALARQSGATSESESEIVAHHFEGAGRPTEALPYWRRAADKAIARSAYREATAHLGRAIALLDRLPVDGGAVERELRNLAGVAYCVLEGGRSERARQSYERALAISADFPESEATFSALCGACFCDYMSGRTASALARAKELLSLAERLGNADLLLEALHVSWAAEASVGDVRGALEATQRGVAIYDPERHHVHVTKFGMGHDSGVCGLGFGSQSLILSGRVAEGRRWIERTRALVGQLDHPFTKCVGLQHASCAAHLLGEPIDALAYAREALAIAEPRKFAMPIAFATCLIGVALVRLNERGEGSSLLSRVLDNPDNAVPANWRPMLHIALARAEFAAGDAGAAETRLLRLLGYAREIGGCIAEPEIYIALADVVGRAQRPRAQAYLATAAAHARANGALLLELRVANERTRYVDEADLAARASDYVELERMLALFADDDADCPDVRIGRATLDAMRSASGA